MKLTNLIETEYMDVEECKKEILSKKLDISPLLSTFENILEYEHDSFADAMDYLHESEIKSVMEKSAHFTKDYITAFSVELSKYAQRKKFKRTAGIFLTNLIHFDYAKSLSEEKSKNISEEKYLLFTEGYAEKLSHLGRKLNGPNITLIGDSGDYFCYEMIQGTVQVNGSLQNDCCARMRGGNVTVEENCGKGLGEFMQDGSIVVKGNSDSYPGHKMEGGRISIEGNCTFLVGWMMKGGEIVIYKNVDGAGDSMLGGKIYLKQNGTRIGSFMKKGIVFVEGETCILSSDIAGGTVFHKNKKIFDKLYKKDNENIEEKIMKYMKGF